jgi:hypothetical protein
MVGSSRRLREGQIGKWGPSPNSHYFMHTFLGTFGMEEEEQMQRIHLFISYSNWINIWGKFQEKKYLSAI